MAHDTHEGPPDDAVGAAVKHLVHDFIDGPSACASCIALKAEVVRLTAMLARVKSAIE
jgi:hypothetical protein